MKTPEAVMLAYQDRLRTWAVRNTVRAWRLLDLDNIDATFPRTAALSAAVHEAATAYALTATDEYMALLARAAGSDYLATWMAGSRVSVPTELMSGAPYTEWMSKAPRSMKYNIGQGMAPSDAANLSLKRTVNEVGTGIYQYARSTTWNRFLVDSVEPKGWTLPEELLDYRREVQTYPELWDGKSRREYKGTFERWRRVPSPGACDFCLMLATRTDYTSADAAMYVGGGEGQEKMKTVGGRNQRSGVQRRRSSKRQAGDRYHRACRCTVAMSTSGGWGSQGESIQMSREAYDAVLAKSEHGTISFGGYQYHLAYTDVIEGEGVRLPERAPWADAFQPAPRKKSYEPRRKR